MLSEAILRAKARMQVEIIKCCKFHGISHAVINNWVRHLRKKLLRKLPVKKQSFLQASNKLTIVFVSAHEGEQLNRQFRKKKYATDILSFSPVEASSLGELVFCVPILKKQAQVHELTLKEETLYLLIHGLLHLLGYDHEQSKTKALAMYRLQDELFADMTSRR